MDYYQGDINRVAGRSRGFNIHKVRIENPERVNTLLMVVCIAFLLVIALATFQGKLQPYP